VRVKFVEKYHPAYFPFSSRVSTERSFPMWGLGASAGGLEAFQEFFSNVSSKTGMAFIFGAAI